MGKGQIKINEQELRDAVAAVRKILNGIPLNTQDMKAIADVYEMLGVLQKMISQGVVL